MPSPAALRAPLLAWFEAHARDLPWRRTADPYAIWVSEVMLQQTRVETVVPYYDRWLERFPDPETLALASEEEVLKAWEGLGYYRRARMLHRAAAVVRDRHGGEVPSSSATLRGLPGVGEYTAGAVASIAFGEPVPAVDGNVRRVLSRLFDVAEPDVAWLRDTAGELVDPERPGEFNQALMELGATVCTPRAPRCTECPLEAVCAARAAGTEPERPVPRRREAIPTRRFGVAVIVDGRGAELRSFLVRRASDGLLGGLWEFPCAEMSGQEGEAAAESAARRAAREHGFDPGVEGTRGLAPVRHAYSHFRAVYHPYVMEAEEAEEAREAMGGTEATKMTEAVPAAWSAPERIAALPLPRAHRRIARALAELA